MGEGGGAVSVKKNRRGRHQAAREEVGGTAIHPVNVQMLALLLKEVFILTLP